MLRGGTANNGSNAGLSYSNSNNTPSNANANITSQLSVNERVKALPLGKKCCDSPGEEKIWHPQ